MSILQVCGHDDGLLDPFFYAAGAGVAPAVSTVRQRTGTHSVVFSGGSQQRLRTNWPTALTTGWVYYAFFPTILPASGDGGRFMQLVDNGTVHVELRLNSAGRLVLYRGDGTLLQTGTLVNTINTWVGVAWKFTIADSGGRCEVRINGSSTNDIDFTGDTRNGATASCNQFDFYVQGFQLADAASHTYLDDFLLQDANGAAPENTWLIDPGLYPILPTANDASTGYVVGGTTPVATLWDSVNDPTSDELVTTIESSAVSDFASFVMGTLPSTIGTIYAVVDQIRADKTAVGLRELQARMKLGATVAVSGNLPLATGLRNLQGVFHRDPDGNVWTTANINATKMGVVTAA